VGAIALGVVTAVLPAAPAAAATEARFVHLESGEGVAPGNPDPFNDVSTDGGATWSDAMVVSAAEGWDTIPNTDWISVDGTRGDPARAETTTLFRRAVSFAPGLVSAAGVQLCVHADNAVDVTWNGTTIIDQSPTDTTNASGEPTCVVLGGVMRSGANTILFAVANGTGPMGLNFSVDGTWIQDLDAPPVLTLPADATIAATSPSGAAYGYGTVFARDITGQTISASCTPPSGSSFAVGENVVTCTAAGTNNQTATGTFTVTVLPFASANEPPVLALPGDLSVSTNSTSGKRVWFRVSATDDSGTPPSVVCAPPSGSWFRVGATIVSCTATDDQQATSTGSFVVRVAGPLERACSLLRESLGTAAKSRLVSKLKAAGDALHQARRYSEAAAVRWAAQKVKQSGPSSVRPPLRQLVVHKVTWVMDRACSPPQE
jgi:hypothetical protein